MIGLILEGAERLARRRCQLDFLGAVCVVLLNLHRALVAGSAGKGIARLSLQFRQA